VGEEVVDCETADECLHTKARKLSISDFMTRLTFGSSSRKLRDCRQVLSLGSCLRTREARQESHDKYDICVHAGKSGLRLVLCGDQHKKICIAEPDLAALVWGQVAMSDVSNNYRQNKAQQQLQLAVNVWSALLLWLCMQVSCLSMPEMSVLSDLLHNLCTCRLHSSNATNIFIWILHASNARQVVGT